MTYCFLNGKVMPIEEAKVGIEDIGLLRGYGVYDGLPVFKGQPFRFADHFARFLSGAHILDLNLPITEDSCEKKIMEIVEKSGFVDRANIRMILTGGKTIDGISYDFENPTFFILAEKWRSLPSDFYTDGAKLITYKHKREMPEYKTINYINAVKLQNWRKEEKAVEILYVYDGEVLECATSNVCIVKNGRIITPAENVLQGITLKVVLEIAEKMGVDVERRIVKEEELKEADEVFITSSFKDIVPIVRIDDFDVAGGEVGKTTKMFIKSFNEVLNVL